MQSQVVTVQKLVQFYDKLSLVERAEYEELVITANFLSATLRGLLARVILRTDAGARQLRREIEATWLSCPMTDMSALKAWVAEARKSVVRFENEIK